MSSAALGCVGAAVALSAMLIGCSRPDADRSPAPRPRVAIPPGARTFKVATWNIRSGMGIRGFKTTSWSHDTLNCTDPSQPVNAWGIGLPQAQLERIKSDPAIIALALQEAWNCGSPPNVNGVLGFQTTSRDRNGTALVARHGLSGPVQYYEIDAKARQWLIGGDVCLEPGCAETVPIYSVHFGDTTDDGIPLQAERVLEFLGRQSGPRIFMGDLNVHKTDTWNPKVRCTAGDKPGALRTIGMIEAAGYTDAWKATQNSEGWTGMASRPGCGSPEGNLYKRIDYVYFSGLQAVATAQFGRAAPGGDAPSDHVGLIAELLIAAPRAAGSGETP